MIVLDTIRGLSDSKWSGILGSVASCIGLDIHSTPGLLKVQQKLTKNSGATVDAFCRVKVSASNGYSFWFSYTSGKIWARSSGGTWTLAYTTVPAASWHPMEIQDITLWIGDANQLASVDKDGTFNNNRLDIKTPLRIKCLSPLDEDLLIGTFVATTVNATEIIRWDLVSSSWTTSDPIEEVGINAFIRDDNYVYAQCGRAGNIYYYDGENLQPYKRIPGDYSNVKYGEVYPESVANFKGIPVFGFSNSPEAGNSTGNPADQGVYSFGSYSRDYRKVLDLSWVISEAVVAGTGNRA